MTSKGSIVEQSYGLIYINLSFYKLGFFFFKTIQSFRAGFKVFNLKLFYNNNRLNFDRITYPILLRWLNHFNRYSSSWGKRVNLDGLIFFISDSTWLFSSYFLLEIGPIEISYFYFIYPQDTRFSISPSIIYFSFMINGFLSIFFTS